MIWSLAIFVPVCLCYVLWEFNAVKNATIMDLMKDFVDVSPAVILLVFNRPWADIFLALCLMANMFIYDNWILGGLLFAAAYGSASTLASSAVPFNLCFAIGAVMIMTVVSTPMAVYYKGKPVLKAGACVYAVASLAPCLYTFCVTANPGFLCLVLGDVGLGLYGLSNNNYVKAAANVLYFAGTCLVPLSL